MAALARLYLHLGRFSDAGIALREGWISYYAERDAARPGFDDYDKEARDLAEKLWTGRSMRYREIAGVRNDIEHGGFNNQPLPAATIRSQLNEFISEFERAGKIHFVSRHPGAVEWAARHGIVIDRIMDHLDPAEIQPGDVVIGTLPVNMAAEVCAKGARFFNLSLDLPPDARGRELSADDLERYNARIEEFVIQRVSVGTHSIQS